MSKGCAHPQVLSGCWLPGAGAGPGAALRGFGVCHRWACSKVLSVGWQRILVKSPEEQSKYGHVRKATASLDLGCLCAVPWVLLAARKAPWFRSGLQCGGFRWYHSTQGTNNTEQRKAQGYKNNPLSKWRAMAHQFLSAVSGGCCRKTRCSHLTKRPPWLCGTWVSPWQRDNRR